MQGKKCIHAETDDSMEKSERLVKMLLALSPYTKRTFLLSGRTATSTNAGNSVPSSHCQPSLDGSAQSTTSALQSYPPPGVWCSACRKRSAVARHLFSLSSMFARCRYRCSGTSEHGRSSLFALQARSAARSRQGQLSQLKQHANKPYTEGS